MPPGAKKGVQANLTESTFAEYLEGYSRVVPRALLGVKGGAVRYAIDTVGANRRVIETQFRLGGTLTSVDDSLRYLRLLNPYARSGRSAQPGVSWSVQLDPGPGKRLRLWYMPPASKEEFIITKVGS